jgi:opacity protein-like surface antigen
MLKHFALALAASAALLSHAAAADLPVKAPAAAPLFALKAPCDVTGCTGFSLGGEITGYGGAAGLLNLASLGAGGAGIGLTAAYQWYDGKYWLGARVNVDYDVLQTNPNIAGVTLVSSNKLFAFEGLEFGGNVATMFGISPLSLPGWLSTAVPTVLAGGCQHGSLSGYCVGAGAHFFVPNSRWTIDATYLNAQYGQTQTGTLAGLPVTQSTENRGSFGFSYHF